MITRPRIASTSLFVAAVLLTPMAASAAPAATTTPKALSLTAKDVQHQYGAAFRPFIVHTYKASTVKTCGANYTGGYLVTFANFGKSGRGIGVVSVQSSIFVYGDARSIACASTMHGASLARMLSRRGTTVRSSQLNGVGDSAYLYTTKSPMGPGKNAYSAMIWLTRGRHTATVTVSALGSAPALAGTVTLAKILDGRITRAG